MINDFILKINERAQANIADNTQPLAKGVAKAAGYGALIGVMEGLVVVGATYIVVNGVKLLIHTVKK